MNRWLSALALCCGIASYGWGSVASSMSVGAACKKPVVSDLAPLKYVFVTNAPINIYGDFASVYSFHFKFTQSSTEFARYEEVGAWPQSQCGYRIIMIGHDWFHGMWKLIKSHCNPLSHIVRGSGAKISDSNFYFRRATGNNQIELSAFDKYIGSKLLPRCVAYCFNGFFRGDDCGFCGQSGLICDGNLLLASAPQLVIPTLTDQNP